MKKEFMTVADVMWKSTGTFVGNVRSFTVAMPWPGKMNNHFQSRATTSTVNGLVPAGRRCCPSRPRMLR